LSFRKLAGKKASLAKERDSVKRRLLKYGGGAMEEWRWTFKMWVNGPKKEGRTKSEA